MENALALENEKRDRRIENEKRDRQIDNEKRDRQIENEKRDRQIDNEKRDRQIENERRDRQAEKKDLEQKMELIKIQAAIKNERQDQMLKVKEAQHQLEQLTWEARFGQMEQQLASQPRYSQQPIINSPAPQMLDPNPALRAQREQGEAEQQLLQQPLVLKLQEQEHLQPQPLPQPARQESMGTRAARPTARLPDPTATATRSEVNLQTTTDLAALPPVRQGTTGPTSSAARPQASRRSKQEQHRRRQSAAAQSENCLPSKTKQPQHTGPITRGGSIPLPGDALTHFFLSHCQATGGDQTNAIYLELRQMGFSCW
jgi:hypothetical protein